MIIQFNTVTWYSKLGAVILFILVVPTLTFFIGREYQKTVDVLHDAPATDTSETPSTPVVSPPTSFDPKNATYTIEGEEVTLKNGVAGSDRTETIIFGEPVWGDVSGDGRSDAVFYLSQTTGGTGIFYYVVAMFGENMPSEVFLGDRIAPQNIVIEDGQAVVNYAVRKENDPMTSRPSVGMTKYLMVKEGKLVEISM